MKKMRATMKKAMLWCTVISTAILAFACMEESEYEKQVKQNNEAIEAYLAENNITAKKSNTGIYYEMLAEKAGAASPEPGDVVIINYTMKTLDGELVEANTSSTTKFKFAWTSIMPNGLNYGVDLAKKGEQIRVYLPAYLAFNNYSLPNVFGPNENFIVEMELVDFMTEETMYDLEIDAIESYITSKELEGVEPHSSGLYFKTLEAGTGQTPNDHSQVELHFTRKYLDETVIEKTESGKPLAVWLNEGRLVEGLKQGVLKMKEGEKALLIMPSKIAFGGSIQVIPTALREELIDDRIITTKVLPYSPVMYEVELVDVK